MPSPTCTVNATATTDGVEVSAASTPTIALVSTAGVSTWSISCIGTDETNDKDTVNASLSVDSVNKTATFTAPALGSSLIFRSVVNGGVDVNGTVQSSYTTTFKVCVLTSGGKRVAALGETSENDSEFGWVSLLNDPIRNPAVSSPPTGTGFVHITSGAQDAASKLVENADVHASAAIAGTKISPAFGSQNLSTTGTAALGATSVTGALSGTTTCALGTNPAASGTVRLPNAGSIAFRNQANGADLTALSIDSSNICQVGNATGSTTVTGSSVSIVGATAVTGALSSTSTVTGTAAILGTTPATAGTIRIPNAGDIRFRNQADSANLIALTTDVTDTLIVGNSTGGTSIAGATIGVNSSAALSLSGSTLTITPTGNVTEYLATGNTRTFANSSSEVSADRFAQRRIETVQTTDATVTSLWTLAATSSSVEYIEARVVAIDSGGTKVRVWKIACAYYGSTPTKLGSHVVLEDYSNSDSAAWVLDFDTSGGSIRLRATGAASTTIRWTCDVQILRTKN